MNQPRRGERDAAVHSHMPDRCLLYYITDRTTMGADESSRRRRLLEKIAEAAHAGVDYIQLREKDLTTRELESLAREAISLLTQLKTKNPDLKTALLINSRTDIALAVGADGVHLRSDDISPIEVSAVWKKSHVGTAAIGCPAAQSDAATAASARRLLPQIPLIGVSCHSPEEVQQAEIAGAAFTVFAPIFEKKDVPGAQPAGLAQLQEACQAGIPVLALGGVTLENAQSCLEGGAAGIAGIRLFQENNIVDVVKSIRRL